MLDASLIPGLCWLCLGPLCGMPFHTHHGDFLGTELPYISAAEFINLSLSHDFFKKPPPTREVKLSVSKPAASHLAVAGGVN